MKKSYSQLIKISFISLFVLMAATIGFLFAQDNDPSSEDRLAYFGDAMHPDYRDDILAFPDAPLYTLDVALTATNEQASISGTLSVEYTNQTPDNLNDIVFRLYPNLPSYGGQTTVSDVSIDGQTVSPSLDITLSILTIPLPFPLNVGDSALIQMNFVSTVFAGEINLHAHFSYLNGALALPNFFPLLSVYDSGSGWWQNTAHPTGDAVYSETSFFDVTLTTPLNWVTITSGARVDSAENDDEQTRTSHYVAPLMRDFALMAYPRYATLTDTVDGITVDVHYLPGGLNGARSTLQYTIDSVRVFNELFGHYPYSELDVVETYTVAGGIEYPGLIVIQAESWNANNSYLEFVAAHEVAHQWWYSLVGNDQTRFPWVDESLAQYSTLLYYGQLYGTPTQNAIMTDFQDEWHAYATEFGDQSIGGPVVEYMQHDDAYFRIVYQKGPLFFATLANTYGQDNLINALSDYFDAYHYQVAQPSDLRNTLEQSLQQDLDVLFNDWVGP